MSSDADGITDVILDIDGTLISEGHDDENLIIHRPYLFEFLKYCHGHYRVHIWTAASKEWADAVLDTIPIKMRGFSSVRCGATIRYNSNPYSSDYYRSGYKIKHLGRHYDRDHTIIVDDTPTTFSYNYGNALHIHTYQATSFADTPSDEGLLDVINKLEYLQAQSKEMGSIRDVQRPRWYEHWPVPECAYVSRLREAAAAGFLD